MEGRTVGDCYRGARERLTGLLAASDEATWATPVPACPGWRVHDVVGHLVGVVEDAMAGRLQGPPPPEVTAEEVARHAATAPADLLATWGELAEAFEPVLTAVEMWPGFLDVLSHEIDIREALGVPTDDLDADVRLACRLVVDGPELGAAFDVGDATYGAGGPVLRASSFEVLRLRLGRRTRDQVAAMDWSEPPSAVLDGLFIFEPS